MGSRGGRRRHRSGRSSVSQSDLFGHLHTNGMLGIIPNSKNGVLPIYRFAPNGYFPSRPRIQATGDRLSLLSPNVTQDRAVVASVSSHEIPLHHFHHFPHRPVHCQRHQLSSLEVVVDIFPATLWRIGMLNNSEVYQYSRTSLIRHNLCTQMRYLLYI